MSTHPPFDSARPAAAPAVPAERRRAGRPPAGGTEAAERALIVQAMVATLRSAVAATADADLPWHDTVLDGALALEQLQAASCLERDHVQRLQADLHSTQASLSAARTELLGTQARERRQRHAAEHDSLTALPNRRGFRARLDDVLGSAERPAPQVAVLYLDLDGFQPINDQHGHATGDELLRIVAERLSRNVRADDMVCRLGGDEFACLLSHPMGREQLGQIARKLFDAVSAPLQLGELHLSVRPSIGIAVCPGDGDTPGALLKRADAAMYRAKRRQLGYAFFDRRSDA